MADSDRCQSSGDDKKTIDEAAESSFPHSKNYVVDTIQSCSDDTAICSVPEISSSTSDVRLKIREKRNPLEECGEDCRLEYGDKNEHLATDVLCYNDESHNDSCNECDDSRPLNGTCADPKLRPSTLPLIIQSLPKGAHKRYPSDPDLQCGFTSNLKAPYCMQRFATKSFFLLIFCLASILQGMYYTYFVSVLTTIEKLFQIKSKTTGVIMSATEIGQIGGGLFLSYYGGKGHRPKWISGGMLIFAVSAFVCALPHYLFGNDLLRDYLALTPSEDSPLTTANICNPPETAYSTSISELFQNGSYNSSWKDQDCHGSSHTSNIVLGIFFVALLGVGVGQTAVYILGIPYIDDNVGARESPSYFGITMGLRIFGPTLGFVLGALCTSTYIDPLADPGFEPTDPRWIGAWWLGLIIISVCLFIVSFFMMMFPRNLPATSSQRPYDKAHKISETNSSSTVTLRSDHVAPHGVTTTCSHTQSPNLNLLSPLGNQESNGIQRNPQIHPESPMHSNHSQIFPKIEPQLEGSSKMGKKPISPIGNPVLSRTKKTDSSFHSLSGKFLYCFSRRSFRKSKRKATKECLECNRPNSPSQDEDFRDFLKSLYRLLKNKVLLLRTASSVLHLLPISGLYTFLPKYLETQFRLTVHSAAMISGTGGILVMGIGIFSSGIVIRKLNPSPRVVAGWISLTALLYSIGMVILMFLGCSHDDLKGLVKVNGSFYFEPLCENSCSEHCDPSIFSPICSNQGNTYFSACHAGCSSITLVNGTKELLFEDCECLEEGVSASLRLCDANCPNLPWYIAVFCLFVIIHSTSEVGGMLLTLRCVNPHDKAMALGLISVAIGLFGNVPCPIMYGAVIDSACIQWRETCKEQGACQLYDTETFRYFFHGTTASVMFLAFIVDLVVWHYSDEISFSEVVHKHSPEQSSNNKMSSYPTQATLQSPLESPPPNTTEESCISPPTHDKIPECIEETTPLNEAAIVVPQEEKLNLNLLDSEKELRESFI